MNVRNIDKHVRKMLHYIFSNRFNYDHLRWWSTECLLGIKVLFNLEFYPHSVVYSLGNFFVGIKVLFNLELYRWSVNYLLIWCISKYLQTLNLNCYSCEDCESYCNLCAKKVKVVSLIVSDCSSIQGFYSGIIHQCIFMMANYRQYLFIKLDWQTFLSHLDVNGGRVYHAEEAVTGGLLWSKRKQNITVRVWIMNS